MFGRPWKCSTPRTARMLLIDPSPVCSSCSCSGRNFAVLDEVKRGNGKVVPSRQIQVVQSLEGGIVSEMLIQEGAIVRKDQPLARIDDTNFAAQLGEIRERRACHGCPRRSRLEAEAFSRTSVEFPEDLTKLAPRARSRPNAAVFDAHMRKLAQDIDVLAQQEWQKQREIDELRASETRFSETLTLLTREAVLTRRLYEQKVVPEIEMLRSDRQATEMRGQLAAVQATMVKTAGRREEAQSRPNITTASVPTAEDDLAKSRGDLAVLEETDQVGAGPRSPHRTAVAGPRHRQQAQRHHRRRGGAAGRQRDGHRAAGRHAAGRGPHPSAGHRLHAPEPGGGGEAQRLRLVGLWIAQGQGRTHQRRYHHRREGRQDMSGGETFYRVMVRTDKNHLGTAEQPLPIIPGMVATVEILTGEKSVLDYLDASRPACCVTRRFVNADSATEHLRCSVCYLAPGPSESTNS